MSSLAISTAALWVVVVVQALFILALFRYLGLLLERVPAQGPPIGLHAPRRSVGDLDGDMHHLGTPSGHHHLLLFTSPTCPWCERLEPDIAPFASSIGPGYRVLLVLADATGAQARQYAERIASGASANLRVVPAPELFESYGVPGTPYGLLIDREGVVRSKGTANTLTDLRTLVDVSSTERKDQPWNESSEPWRRESTGAHSLAR